MKTYFRGGVVAVEIMLLLSRSVLVSFSLDFKTVSKRLPRTVPGSELQTARRTNWTFDVTTAACKLL